jgi:redox-sensitive bicupin YhaK (pirin superfamily)
MENTKKIIQLQNIWKSQEVNEGDGAQVRRVIGIKKMDYVDPFLMLDHLEYITLPAGFPDHPHRGFETVTYVLKGNLIHEDFKGHKGQIGAGDIQWMTAGKGIVHSEMPASKTEPASGFQLWVNLSSQHKMVDPYYQEIKADKIPKLENENVKVAVVAGKFEGVEGPCKSISGNISFFDIELNRNSELLLPIEDIMHGFVYVFEGDSLYIGENKLAKYQAGNFISDTESLLQLKTPSNKARLLLVYGKELKEKVAKYGPFVMNTNQEIEQTFEDYQLCKNGFEDRKAWKSKNSLLKYS